MYGAVFRSVQLPDRVTLRVSLLPLAACLLLLSGNSQAQDRPFKSQYIRQTGKDSVIVFVHGVLGDARATWTNDTTKAFWPDLMKEDSFFNRFDIYVYSYSSPFRGAAYTVEELAEDLRRDLDTSDIFRKHKEVLFLCHSMGGIVVRAFLTRYRPQAAQVPMIYFFSTPTTGAQIAGLGKLLSNNPQLRTILPMGSADDYLAAIQKDWLAANFSIASYCAYETQDTFGVRVVGEANATNLCNRRLDPINANHTDIVKPRDRSAVPYVSFRNAVRELQERTTTKRPITTRSRAAETSEQSPAPQQSKLTSSKASARSDSPVEVGDPVANLARLGWNIKVDGQAGISFEIIAKPLPNMEESANYFRGLRQTFQLNLQQVSSIAGIRFLSGINNCGRLEIGASDIADISELRDLTGLRTLVISQTPFTVHNELDIRALASLTNLEDLNLNMSQVTALEPLRGLKKLVLTCPPKTSPAIS
jgi:pimeloyl-ACP methyl ester carboxylesterase